MKRTAVNVSGQGKTQSVATGLPPTAAENASEEALWDKKQGVERLGGDEELFWELCEIFLEESPKLLQKLGQAIAESDPEAVMRAAHSLKGELGYLGAREALQASRALEDMGHEKNLSAAADVFALLQGHLAALHLAMKSPAGIKQ